MKSSVLNMQLAIVGLPGSGKTSYLAALYATGLGRTASGAEWTVKADDAASEDYLGEAWVQLREGQPVQPTLTHSEHPELSLVLSREEDARLTHRLALKCIDTAGEFARSKEQRVGPAWERVAGRIQSAHVLLLVFDAMNVLHCHLGDRRSEAQFHGLTQMLSEACRLPSATPVPLKRKLLGVCFCKCDAVSLVDIDGFEDDRDALILADTLVPPRTQALLLRDFAAVHYFGVSVLRDRWRWARGGACVRVGYEAVDPVGLFEPFEWVSSVWKGQK